LANPAGEVTSLPEPYSTGLGKCGTPVRIVLDTNVVLDLLLYADARIRPVALGLGAGTLQLVTDGACLSELADVLGRESIGGTTAERDAALAAYRRMATTIADVSENAHPALPQCRDATDQKFMALALRSKAKLLVSRDRALLELRRRVALLGVFEIVDPEGASAWLAGR
jgi:putative PIN family toxin of toxin-antitoxin system